MTRQVHIGIKAVLLGGFLASYASVAYAQTSPACQTIDTILQTVSVVRDIQTNPSTRDYAQNLVKLDRLTMQISLPTLMPIEGSGAAPQPAPIGTDAVTDYVSNMRAALALAGTQARQDAKPILTNGLTQDFSNSLQSVEKFWSCTSGENALQTGQLEGSEDHTGVTSAVIEYEQSQSERPSLNASESKGLSANSRVLNQSKVGRDVDFELTPPFFLVGGFLLLILGLFVAQRRSKRFKARAKRRILNVPVRVKFAKTDVAMVLVDISRNGVKVQHGELLGGQKKVNLHINGKWLSGHVIWSNDSFAGVQFKRPMKALTFNAFVETALGSKGVAA